MYVRQSSQESIQITDAEIWTNSKASIGDCQGRAKRSWNGGLVRHSSSGSLARLAGELRPCRGEGLSATQRPAWHSIPGRAPSEDAALAAGGENGVMWTDRRRRLSWRWCGGREDPEQLEPESPRHCVVYPVMDVFILACPFDSANLRFGQCSKYREARADTIHRPSRRRPEVAKD